MTNRYDPKSRAGEPVVAGPPPLAGRVSGYTSRPLNVDDTAAVYDLETAGEAFDDGVVEVDLSDLEADWRRPSFDPATMSIGVSHGDQLVAYATVFKGRAEALVRPDYRGQGIGTALVRWTRRVARADGRDSVGQTISKNERSAEALFRASDYEYGHTSWILEAGLSDQAVPSHSALPGGYRFHPYRQGEDEREIFALIDTAFDEWRGSTSESMGFDNWAASTLYRLEPELVILITHAECIAGTAIGHDYGPHGGGWIQEVAVAREHRRQGLGRALLEEGFRRFRDLGRRQCGASTDSRTGALGLYERSGMSVRRSCVRWMKRGL